MVKPQFIDLFAGCGGLSLGLMQSGWQGLFAIEHERNAFETLQYNLLNKDKNYCFKWPNWFPKKPHSIQETLDHFSPQLLSLKGKVEMIVGGPPCQGYSMAGKRYVNDPRNALYITYMKFVNIIEPKIVLFENVTSITANFKTEIAGQPINYAANLINDLSKNYYVYWKILNAKDFGVAQSRKRFFAIAIKKDYKPQSSKCPFEILDSLLTKWLLDKGVRQLPVSVKSAISDFEEKFTGKQASQETNNFFELKFKKTRTNYQKILHRGCWGHPGNLRLTNHSKVIENRFKAMISYSENYSRKGKNIAIEFLKPLGIKKTSIRVLFENIPAPTITSRPDDLIHYSEARILTVRESARLQSFPDWFDFKGKYTTGGLRRRIEVPRYTQVANAVPPFVAEALGIALKNYLKD